MLAAQTQHRSDALRELAQCFLQVSLTRGTSSNGGARPPVRGGPPGEGDLQEALSELTESVTAVLSLCGRQRRRTEKQQSPQGDGPSTVQVSRCSVAAATRSVPAV